MRQVPAREVQTPNENAVTSNHTAARTLDDPALERFRSAIRLWLKDKVAPIRKHPSDELNDGDRIQIRRDWDRVVYEGGFAGLAWPRAFGGRGWGILEELVFYEECALAGAPDGLSRIGRLLVGPTLINHGTAEQQQRYLPKILSGEEIWCQGFSEPNAGSDLAALETYAMRKADNYIVRGSKIWTSFAHYADRCLLLARTSDRPRHRNLSLLMVDMRQPRITISPIQQMTGNQDFNEVRFDGALATIDDRIGDENGGWKVAMTTLTAERGSVEAMTKYVEMLQQMKQLEDCVRHVQNGASRLDELQTSLELIRQHSLRVAELRASDQQWSGPGSILKLAWSEMWQQLTRFGLELSCRRHADYWRRAYLESRATTIYSGTSEIQRNVIAERVLGLPK